MEPDVRGIKLLERPHETKPIAENPEELKELKQEVKRISYSDVVMKETAVELPKNTKELRDQLDRRAEHLTSGSHAEKEHKEKVPQISLRNLENERTWERMGWGEEERTAVKQKLKERLNFDDSKSDDSARLENAIYILIASGKTAQEVLTILNDDAQFNYYYNEEAGKSEISGFVTNNRSPLYQDPNGARRYLYLKK